MSTLRLLTKKQSEKNVFLFCLPTQMKDNGAQNNTDNPIDPILIIVKTVLKNIFFCIPEEKWQTI